MDRKLFLTKRHHVNFTTTYQKITVTNDDLKKELFFKKNLKLIFQCALNIELEISRNILRLRFERKLGFDLLFSDVARCVRFRTYLLFIR